MSTTTFLILFNFVIAIIEFILVTKKYTKWNKRKVNCTCKVKAQVVEVLERKTSKGKILYKPIYIFWLNDKQGKITSAFYTNLIQFHVGEFVELLINPNDYQQFLYENNSYNKGKFADIICCIMPVVFVIMITMMFVYQ